MNIKKLISIPEGLNHIIEEYNRRNPFEPLDISEIAAKAIYERITATYPDLKNVRLESQKPFKEPIIATEPTPTVGSYVPIPTIIADKTGICKTCGKAFIVTPRARILDECLQCRKNKSQNEIRAKQKNKN